MDLTKWKAVASRIPFLRKKEKISIKQGNAIHVNHLEKN